MIGEEKKIQFTEWEREKSGFVCLIRQWEGRLLRDEIRAIANEARELQFYEILVEDGIRLTLPKRFVPPIS